MGAAPERSGLVAALSALTEDAIFALAAGGRAEVDRMRGLAKRRASVYESAARGGARIGIGSFARWVPELCAAIAPVHPPDWMPMAEVVASGLSLEGGARGVRSLFTSKPSEKEVARVKRLGALASRVLAATLGADGPLLPEEQLLCEALVASLGLADDDEKRLLAEPPMRIDALEIYGEIDAKLAKALVRGAWIAAASDAIDPREEKAIAELSTKLRVAVEDVETIRAETRSSLERRARIGAAAIDGIRFVLADDPETAVPIAGAALALLAAPAHRGEAMAALRQNAPVTLSGRHALDRDGKSLVLALAWTGALGENPTLARRADLVARHERLATDLDAGGAASAVRDEIDAFVEGELLGAAAAAVS
jgi:hypothetical protein